jgi:hypothetical protein
MAPYSEEWRTIAERAGKETCGSATVVKFPANRENSNVSKNFERWKELAMLTSKEQDPAKLTELANEMNLVLTQKTLHLDPALHAPLPAAGSHEDSQLDNVLKANAGGKVCFT